MSKENSVNTSITEKLENDSDENGNNNGNNFPAAIAEIGEAIFERFPEKTSKLSAENKIGLIRCRAVNNYFEENFGVRYTILDNIPDDVLSLSVSVDAFGLQTFIAALHSINASFEQHEIPSTLRKLTGR
jgi:hypothetical protein